MAPPPPLPLRTQKSLPSAGSAAAWLPQSVSAARRGGRGLLPAPVGRRLGSLCVPEPCPGSCVLPDAGAGGWGRGRARRAPVRARGRCGAMNGTANPLLDREEHCLLLGESFEKRPRASFHTIRCKSALPAVPFSGSAASPTRAASFPPSALPSPGYRCQRQLPSPLARILRDLNSCPSFFSLLFPNQTCRHSQLFCLVSNSSCEGHWPVSSSFPHPALPYARPPPSLLLKDCDPASDSSSSVSTPSPL